MPELYLQEEFNEIDIFQPDFTKRINLFAAVVAPDDCYIDLYFKSHGKYYDLTYFFNYPEKPFMEMNIYYNPSELDFHEKENCKYYKIPKKDQIVHNLDYNINEISCNLFTLSLIGKDIYEIINKNNSNLEIDEKYRINELDYISISKELLPNSKQKTIEEIR